MSVKEKEVSIGDFNKIMSDHNIFNKIVYTPLSEALRLLEERRKDPELNKKIKKLLNNKIPKILKEKKCGIMARQLATPNHDSRMFISLAKENDLHPVFVEYVSDKFTSNNEYKHSLGQISIQNKIDKNGNGCVEKVTIVDFNKSNGKKLKDVKTLWGESLVDFHKKLFHLYELKNVSFIEEEKDWYKKKKNETAIDFYTNFFLLVTCHGILFENFLVTQDSEGDFTKNVVLPAFEKVVNLTGVKPLIIPVGALDLETEDFWYHHLPIIKNNIK